MFFFLFHSKKIPFYYVKKSHWYGSNINTGVLYYVVKYVHHINATAFC